MFRNALAILLTALMVLPLQAQQTPPTVQEQVGQSAKGSIIEVKMKQRKMKKVTGRLGEVTAEGFEVQVAQGQTVDNVTLRYADVKSVTEKPPNKGTRTWVKVVVGVVLVVAAVSVIGAIVCATQHGACLD
jgi:uncharacterized cupredoxin-like copper-binding protein